MNSNLYKLFNLDLKNLNHNQLITHFKNKGVNENRIYSFESFFHKYPYYEHESYKLYNTDIKINDKIELMVHWHLYGNKDNRICSDKHFEILCPNFDMNKIDNPNLNIYEIKNTYYKNIIHGLPNNINEQNDKMDKNVLEKNDIIKNNDIVLNYNIIKTNEIVKNNELKEDIIEYNYILNPNKNTIGIFIDKYNKDDDDNFYLKSLSLINYYDMNIIVFLKDNNTLTDISFLRYIDYYLSCNLIDSKNEYLLIKLCNYIIINNINNYDFLSKNNDSYFNNLKKIYIRYDILNNTYFSNNIIYIDNHFNHFF